jgi:hypothetical protein
MFFWSCAQTWNRGLSQEYKQRPGIIRRSLRLNMNEVLELGHTCVSKDRVTALQTSRRYFSRYFGKRVANDDSSVNVPPLLSVGWKASTFH